MAKKISKRAWNEAKDFIPSEFKYKDNIFVKPYGFFNGVYDDNIISIVNEYLPQNYQLIEIYKHATYIEVTTRCLITTLSVRATLHHIYRRRVSTTNALYNLLKIILLEG